MERQPDLTTPVATTPVASSGAADDAAHDAARRAAGGETGGRGDGGATAGETAVGVGAGAVAGTMAGLQAGALAGAVTLGLGAVAGAAMGAAAGAALAQEADASRFTAESDAHYRALYDGGLATDRGYEAVRPAYVFGHVAASEPALAGRSFDEAEPALARAWDDELRPRAGAGSAALPWDAVRRHVRDAFGHARADGAGDRRDPRVVGSGGSAVDPVELDRARRGLPSAGA